MNFWDISELPSNPLIVDDEIEKEWFPGELQNHINKLSNIVADKLSKKLIMILGENNISSLIGYLAGLQSGHTVMLISANTKEDHLSMLVDEYEPDFIFAPLARERSSNYKCEFTLFGYGIYQCIRLNADSNIYGDLAVLLATSGSTGNSKFVRLSYKNLQENARSIAAYLGLSSKERPITSLQMNYSYGLSVLNSHLLVGAKILLTSHRILTRVFWDFACKYQATSISGVPYIYTMLKKINFQNLAPKSLRTITQAGGKLNAALLEHYYELSQQRKWKFYVMYGQTEATARISYVPLDRQASKLTSIGIAIPGGELELDADTQEIVYCGPNVMLGYANRRLDLVKGDELCGVLRTGDIGKKDEDGFYYIVGRNKRFVKLFGLRMNLDDIEESLKNKFGGFVACVGDDKKLYVSVMEDIPQREVCNFLLQSFDIHHSVIEVEQLQQMPLHSNNKVNYRKLKEMIAA